MDRKDNSFTIRVSTRNKQKIKQAAKKDKKDVTNWLLDLAFQRITELGVKNE